MVQRPQHEEEGYLPLNEDILLAELVRRSDLPWGNRFRLLHDIATLRGYVQNESRRVLAEPVGRCN